jgi:rubredoxin
VLTESAPFRVFERFGFQSGGTTDKFAGVSYSDRSANGLRYIPEHVSGVISGRVLTDMDCGTHTLFFADVTEAFTLSNERSVTYQYYFDHIKPAPPRPKEGKTGFVCKICGYVHEGDTLPDDFICPLCKHGAEDFERL